MFPADNVISCRLNVCLMDGQALDFEPQFDAVFSHAAMHWMPDHDVVFKVGCSIWNMQCAQR